MHCSLFSIIEVRLLPVLFKIRQNNACLTNDKIQINDYKD
jgi:hypothetical protein